MPKSKRRPAAVAKKKAAAQQPASIRRPIAPPEEAIGTERIGSVTAVKRYRA